MRILSFIFFIFSSIASAASDTLEVNKKNTWALTAIGNYSFSGFGVVPAVEFICKNNIFYAGPKLITTRNYLPNKGPWGVNIGYKHEFRNFYAKSLSFIFFSDYQVLTGKAFSRIQESDKRNYYHELFIGYGIQLRISKHVYIGNTMGLGVHVEVFNNIDLDWKQTYYGYNNLFRLYASYRF